ncbi:MAG: hypothetical protein NVSMB19_12050 [Vulcanimicrobiaceae bacterium]
MIVTISREYGAAGLAVADGVAEALGYALFTDELPRSVAARLGTSTDALARATGAASFSERLLGGLEAGTPEIHSPSGPAPDAFDETVRREIERTIRERAVGGDVVFLGRNAGSILGKRPDILRVFLTGDRAWRVARLVEAFGGTAATADADVERVDAVRRKFAKERYKTVWGDARHYDLILDASRFGVERTVALIAAAARSLA